MATHGGRKASHADSRPTGRSARRVGVTVGAQTSASRGRWLRSRYGAPVFLLLGCVDPGVLDIAGADPDETGGAEAGDSGEPDTGETAGDASWNRFVDGRADAMDALAEPVAVCVERLDTVEPLFGGCYDWHSAVHGHFALLAASRAGGSESWAALVDERLTSEAIAGETSALRLGRPSEVPYGYAWLLRLVVERRAQGLFDLDAIGLIAADALSGWLARLSDGQRIGAVHANDYGNYSWALVNLWAWAEDTGDVERAAALVDLARELRELPCDLRSELTNEANFFPACLMRAHALATILPDDEVEAWLTDELPDEFPLAPVTAITSAHVSGLNFSRAWGLWSLYEATGDERWRSMVQTHVEWHLDHPEYWAENYDAYAHWVPQFGVYALALSGTD